MIKTNALSYSQVFWKDNGKASRKIKLNSLNFALFNQYLQKPLLNDFNRNTTFLKTKSFNFFVPKLQIVY